MEMRAFSQVLAYTEHWLHLMSHVGLLKSSLRRAAAGVKKCFPPRMYVNVPAHPAAWWAAVMDPIILDVTGHLCQQQSQYVPFTYGFWPQLPHPKRFSELVPPMHRTTSATASQGGPSKAIRAFLSKANISFSLFAKHCPCNRPSKSTSS